MKQTCSFNLVDERWIPCLKPDGTVREYSIRETLARAHRLRAIAGETPLVTASLHRFLLAILHRVFGPASYDAWANLWQAKMWDMTAIDAYLNAWRDRFDLFDQERPFYQAPDSRVKPKSIISLSHAKASGNNPTLFDHHTEVMGDVLLDAEAARTVITAQAFGLAGLSGIKQKFTDGTCAGGIVFVIEGDDLRATQLLNMIRYPDESEPFASTEADAPAWEMDDPFSPPREYPHGYLDYLTWQNRRVLLCPERNSDGMIIVKRMTMGPGLRFEPMLLDPMKHYRPDKKLGHVAVSFREERSLWRDSATLFAFHDDIQDRYRPPATLKWLYELVDEGLLEAQHTYACSAFGMSKKQAKVFFYRSEHLPLPLSYLSDQGLVSLLKTALDNAERLAFDLVSATRKVGMGLQLSDADNQQWAGLNVNAKNSINDWVKHSGVERAFWASLDLPFQRLMLDLPEKQEEALEVWYEHLRRSALVAYDRATEYVGSDGRSFKAIVRGRQYLNYRLRQVLPGKEYA